MAPSSFHVTTPCSQRYQEYEQRRASRRSNFPDWHSASWLAAHELHPALEHAHYSLTTASEEFRLLVEYVGAVAARKGQATRVVFWFDN
jgi:hypothetical protein